MHQRSGSRGQHFHERQYDRRKVNAHGQRNADFNGMYSRIGQPFQIRDL